jgi:DNA-directed RNA polymerase specialized sigma24 family protein
MLDALITRLPATERAAYVLHDVEGMSDASVAIDLLMTEAEMRQRLHNARLQLRAMWLAE